MENLADISQSVSPHFVADQVLWLRRKIETTPMHVLKLVYLAHGWMLGFTDRALIYEPVEAWTYGPVVPSIYHRYKSFGGDPITGERIDQSERFDTDQLETIELVVEAYKDYTALELSNITHQKDTPWDIIRRESGTGTIIPNELIRDFYRRRINESSS